MSSNRNAPGLSGVWFPKPSYVSTRPGPPKGRGLFLRLDSQTRFWNQISGLVGVRYAARSTGMPPTSPRLRAAGANVNLTASETAYANLAKTWLTLAGDLDEIDLQLKAEPEKKAG